MHKNEDFKNHVLFFEGNTDVSTLLYSTLLFFWGRREHAWPWSEDYLVCIYGYTFVRQDHKLGGSGVTLYARSTLKVKILENQIQ